jgi:hypothetical protein
VVADYRRILDDIVPRLWQIVPVRYRTSNRAFDGTLRTVRIELNACGESQSVQWTYTPGQVPTIVRTPATITLSNSPQAEGVGLTLACNVVDIYPPFVNDVRLWYRTTGATVFNSLPMTHGAGTLWSVNLPASAVLRYGIDYYMRATDGIQTVTTPAVDAALAPHQIAVMPNSAPQITVLSMAPQCEGQDMVVRAEVVDTTSNVDLVRVRYREAGALLYTEANFVNVGGNVYEITIPRTALLAAADLEIEIRARDNYGVSSVWGPIAIDILDCSAPGGCVWQDATTGPLNNSGLDGHGVAWGDLDGDGDDDLYLANNGPNKLLRNDGNGVFTEVPHGVGENSYDSRGAAWGDYDNDGDLDLYVVNWNGPNVLYRNDGGVLVNATAGDAGCPLQGNNAAWADYDNDGDLDLFVTNFDGPNKLLNNDGGVFTSVASAVGFTDLSRGCAWGDYDNDGDPDLYVSVQDGPNHLFRNDRGVLVDVTVAPLDDRGKGKGVAWADYDNDGDLDLYLVNRFTANRLFVNDGGVFTISPDVATADEGDGRSCGWGDYNNDGWLDLYVTNYSGDSKLFHNQRGVSFADTTCGALLTPITAWGMGWNDYDSDGDLDLYVSNHNYEGLDSHMFRNDLITNKSWLRVELEGTTSNRGGIGAKVVATDPVTGLTQMREITAGSGYMSQQAAVAQFGLDDASRVNLTISWPSGVIQTLENQPVNQRLVITESNGASDVPNVGKPLAYSVSNSPNPFNPLTKIEFALPIAGAVSLNVYDIDGHLVKSLLNGAIYGSGTFSVDWNGTTNDGRKVASGVYLYRFTSGAHEQTGRMLLMK